MSLTTRITEGAAVISLADMKTYLKITTSAEDALITAMIVSATLHAELWLQRDLRESVYEFLTTDFGEINTIDFPYRVSTFHFSPLSEATLQIKRATVKSVDKIEFLQNLIFIDVDASVYYPSIRIAKTFLLLNESMTWPTTASDIEDNVKVTFTMAIPQNIALAVAGIQRHVSLMYEERGDCGPEGAGALGSATGEASGAHALYQGLQVPSL